MSYIVGFRLSVRKAALEGIAHGSETGDQAEVSGNTSGPGGPEPKKSEYNELIGALSSVPTSVTDNHSPL